MEDYLFQEDLNFTVVLESESVLGKWHQSSFVVELTRGL